MKDLNKVGKIISCIMPKGKGSELVQALYEKGIHTYVFNTVRGYDARDLDKKGSAREVEKDLVQVICKDEAQGEELFDYIYFQAKINEPRGGLMYMSNLGSNSNFALPKLSGES